MITLSYAGATPARSARQRSPLLFMFAHPAGIWMRACNVFGKHGDMLVSATVNSRDSRRPGARSTSHNAATACPPCNGNCVQGRACTAHARAAVAGDML